MATLGIIFVVFVWCSIGCALIVASEYLENDEITLGDILIACGFSFMGPFAVIILFMSLSIRLDDKVIFRRKK